MPHGPADKVQGSGPSELSLSNPNKLKLKRCPQILGQKSDETSGNLVAMTKNDVSDVFAD